MLRSVFRLTQVAYQLSSSPLSLKLNMSYPSTVKAVAIAKTGGFEVIEDMTLPFPEQKPGDVLVKVCIVFKR